MIQFVKTFIILCLDFEGWQDRWFLAQFLLSCGFGFILILATVLACANIIHNSFDTKHFEIYCTHIFCVTSFCSGCVHPVQFCSDNHHHWLPEEYPDHLSGHDDRRYCLLPIYIAYILSWWLEATTSTAFSTSSGSTSASLEVLSTQKVSLEEICFCCFHQHFLLQ